MMFIFDFQTMIAHFDALIRLKFSSECGRCIICSENHRILFFYHISYFFLRFSTFLFIYSHFSQTFSMDGRPGQVRRRIQSAVRERESCGRPARPASKPFQTSTSPRAHCPPGVNQKSPPRLKPQIRARDLRNSSHSKWEKWRTIGNHNTSNIRRLLRLTEPSRIPTISLIRRRRR